MAYAATAVPTNPRVAYRYCRSNGAPRSARSCRAVRTAVNVPLQPTLPVLNGESGHGVSAARGRADTWKRERTRSLRVRHPRPSARPRVGGAARLDRRTADAAPGGRSRRRDRRGPAVGPTRTMNCHADQNLTLCKGLAHDTVVAGRCHSARNKTIISANAESR